MFPLKKKRLLLQKRNVLSLGLLMNLRKGVKRKIDCIRNIFLHRRVRERIPLIYLGIS